MYICLSSGARPRYRDDVLRALAMPAGTRLQFRYDRKWVAPEVLHALSNGGTANVLAVIAYIDQHDPSVPPFVIPCRYASVSEAVSHGSTVSLVLTVHEFAYAQDLEALNEHLLSELGSNLPHWEEGGTLRGFYWLETRTEIRGISRSAELDEWESIVCQLAQRKDFSEERCFYSVRGLYRAESDHPLPVKSQSYQLRPGTEYETRIYHFHPESEPQEAWLRLAGSSRLITFTSSAVAFLDSRYDLKRVRFCTGTPKIRQKGVLSIYRGSGEPTAGHGTWEFDMDIAVKSVFWVTLLIAVLIGILLAAPHVIATLSSQDLPIGDKIGIWIASALAGLAAGFLAAFGLRKEM